MIKYALLGLLRERSDYGYSLKQRFEERLGTVWHLNTGQVYQTLRVLQSSGLVRKVMVEEADDPTDPHRPRHFFELTPKGEKTLDRWLQRPPLRSRPARDETLLRLLVLQPERHAEALDQIRKLAHLYKTHVVALTNQKRRLPSPPRGALFVREIGLEAALLHTEAHLKWLEYTEERLALVMAAENGGGV